MIVAASVVMTAARCGVCSCASITRCRTAPSRPASPLSAASTVSGSSPKRSSMATSAVSPGNSAETCRAWLRAVVEPPNPYPAHASRPRPELDDRPARPTDPRFAAPKPAHRAMSPRALGLPLAVRCRPTHRASTEHARACANPAPSRPCPPAPLQPTGRRARRAGVGPYRATIHWDVTASRRAAAASPSTKLAVDRGALCRARRDRCGRGQSVDRACAKGFDRAGTR